MNGEEPKVWAFIGDGETDEPETLGSLTLASRENLDNLIWVVNCNLQRLDGPVRGNGKIIQELEAAFRGAGWNVIKVIWGSDWDQLLAADKTGLLLKRMEEAVDGDYQKYSVEPGSYTRKHFFGKYPELLELVNHLTDEQIHKLLRGGHDTRKVYAAYKAAMEHKGQPTVILAKTVKGYGLGEAGEGRNISHQQKKMNEKELREFRARFNIPISDDDIAETPFFRPAADSPETKYLLERRKKLGGFLPQRIVKPKPLEVPKLESFAELFKGSARTEVSTTMAFVRLLSMLLRNKSIGRADRADHSRRGAHVRHGRAVPRDRHLLAPRASFTSRWTANRCSTTTKRKDGQILEEGITEAGAMSSFIAAGTALRHPRRADDAVLHLLLDVRLPAHRRSDVAGGRHQGEGFLLGATAGRTTLNGEGLQHQDGHSLLLASTIPTLLHLRPGVRLRNGGHHRRRPAAHVCEGEDIFYYLTLYNENYPMPPMPEGVEEGILKGLYKFKAGPGAEDAQGAHLRQRADHPRGAAGAGNSGRTLRRVGRCLERHQLQAAAHRRPAASAGTCCTRRSRRRNPTSRPCSRKSRARSSPCPTT